MSLPARDLPAIGRMIVRATYPSAERSEVSADLAAEFNQRAQQTGRPAAHLWLWAQLLRSVPILLRRGFWRGWTGYESPSNAMRPGGAPFEGIVMDLRFAVRRLRARPLYAALAVLTLALGIGGSTAIYSIARTFLIEPLPFKDESQLAVFWHVGDWSEEELAYLGGKAPGFSAIAGFRLSDATLRDGDTPARMVHGTATTADFFDVLGTRPMIGGTFGPGADAQHAPPVVVLSHTLWQELGADPSIVGTRLTLDGTPHTVIGVMPAGFWFPDPTTMMWRPAALDPANSVGNYGIFGRRLNGDSPKSSASSLTQLSRILADRFVGPRWPSWLKEPPAITPMREFFFGPVRPALIATLVAMGFILLMACANVAALMLGQVDGRSTELAVRSALGANRGRIAQQVLLESLVIGALAALTGAAIATWAFRVLVSTLPLGALASSVTMSYTLFVAALAIAFVAAVLIAMLPIIALWRGELSGALAGSRTGGIGGGSRVAGALVVGEVALAVLMAAGAGLLVRSVGKLYDINPGVARSGIAIVDVVSPADLTVAQRRLLFRELARDVGGLGGVRSVSIVQRAPMRGSGWTTGMVIPERPDVGRQTTFIRIAGPRYFETMGIPIISGRDFTNADTGEREAAIVVNAALVSKYFGSVDPIGKQIDTGFGQMGRVIGVVGNVAEGNLTDGATAVRYVSYDQIPFMVPSQTIVARASGGDAAALLVPLQRMIQRVAPGVAIQQATTVDAEFDRAVGPARQVMFLLTLLTTLALVLGAIGVYGVISQFATRRRREWSIRIALGLAPSRVVRHVVGRGTKLVAVGLVIGLAGMALLCRLVTPFLYGVHVNDAASVMVAVVVLLTVGVLAALVPALRAGRVDPALVLRDQ